MLQSYLRVLIRNIARQKIYAGITIFGLTVGITFAMLIGVFVWGELQVNQNLKDIDRLFLVEVNQKSEASMPAFFVPAMLGERAVEKYPQTFQNYYRFRDRAITVSRGDQHMRIQSMIGDSTLIDMFGFAVLHGTADAALNSPNAMVITEKVARLFFNRPDVAGEYLTVSTENNGLQDFQVTAVLKDLPEKNSVSDFMNMDAQVFLSHYNRQSFNLGGIDDWGASIITYLKLAPATSGAEAKVVLNKLLADEAPHDVRQGKTISLKPLSNYYLVTNHAAVQKLILALTIIAVFILLLAIVNFVNITVARSFSRLREVGVRKVVGAVRRQILSQFLAEALVFSTVSLLLSLLFYEALHGHANDLLGMDLPSASNFTGNLFFVMAGGSIIVGLIAGAYPALFLSAGKTTALLKGRSLSVKGTLHFSRALVVIQYTVAIFVFTMSIIMSRQISYFMEADVGYDKSQVMIVSSVPRLWNEDGFNRMEHAKNEFQSSAKIASVSLSWGAPNFNFSPYSARVYRPGASINDGVLAVVSATDQHYADVYGIDVVAGKFFFNGDEPNPPNQVVINESAQKALSLEVGDKLSMEFSNVEFTIAGVVSDFNFESFHKPIQPVVLVHTRDFQAFRYFSFKIISKRLDEAVSEVERLWKRIFPNDPFVYHFTDDRVAVVYQTELQLKKASVIASVLILIIILTGVVGLLSLNLARRTKEVGIRKVLGASVPDILLLVSREYMLILLISFLAGAPLSIVFGWRWLDNFAYKVDMQWWLFTIPILLITVMTLLLVVAQSMKTSLANPVDSLKQE